MSPKDKTTLYKQTFFNHLKMRMAVHQAKLVEDLLTLQDKKIHSLFQKFHEDHRDLETLNGDIRKLLNFKDTEPSSIIKPIRAPTNSLSSDPVVEILKDRGQATHIDTPVFDGQKAKRMDTLKEEINLSAIKINPVEVEAAPEPEQDELGEEEDSLPTFNEALLQFVLQKEGISDKFIAKLLKCIDACNRGDDDASEQLISEFVDYGKSRLVNILKDDFTYKETSYILRNPETFKETFEKSNRLRADPKAYLKANLKETLKSLDLDANQEDDLNELDSPV